MEERSSYANHVTLLTEIKERQLATEIKVKDPNISSNPNSSSEYISISLVNDLIQQSNKLFALSFSKNQEIAFLKERVTTLLNTTRGKYV